MSFIFSLLFPFISSFFSFLLFSSQFIPYFSHLFLYFHPIIKKQDNLLVFSYKQMTEINYKNTHTITSFLYIHNRVKNEIFLVTYSPEEERNYIKYTARVSLIKSLKRYKNLYFKDVLIENALENIDEFIDEIVQYKWILLRDENGKNIVKLNFIFMSWYFEMHQHAEIFFEKGKLMKGKINEKRNENE